MKRAREVRQRQAVWHAAARELGRAIDIEMRAVAVAGDAGRLALGRFRSALIRERKARRDYVKALRAAHARVPRELVADLDAEVERS